MDTLPCFKVIFVVITHVASTTAKQVKKNAKAKASEDPNEKSLAAEIRKQARVQVERMYKFVGMCSNLADNWEGDYLQLKDEPELGAAIREMNE